MITLASSIQLEATLEVLKRKYNEQKSLLAKMNNNLTKLQQHMKSEEEDVQQLEGDTFKAALFKLIRIHDGQLSKEQSEYLKAKYAYENHQFEITEAEKQLNLLERKVRETELELQSHKSTLYERMDALNRLEPNTPQRVLFEKFVAKEKDCKSECVEIEEAIAACERAWEAKLEVQNSLSSADDWAFWDTWGGGGLITDMVKYDKIDDAQVQFKRLSAELSHLKRELSDVGQSISFDMVAMDPMTKGLDIWFDNIFTDLKVKDEIQNQISVVNLLNHELSTVRLNLDQKYEVAQGALKASTEALENFLLDI